MTTVKAPLSAVNLPESSFTYFASAIDNSSSFSKTRSPFVAAADGLEAIAEHRIRGDRVGSGWEKREIRFVLRWVEFGLGGKEGRESGGKLGGERRRRQRSGGEEKEKEKEKEPMVLSAIFKMENGGWLGLRWEVYIRWILDGRLSGSVVRSDTIMTRASQLLRHYKKLRSAQNVLQYEPVALVRYFSKDVGAFIVKGDGSNKCALHSKRTMNGVCKSEYLDIFKISSGLSRNSFCRTLSKTSSPLTGLMPTSSFSCIQPSQRRCYSSSSDLPPHQEIGMPSLSPTMTEGNIARWLKKEGEKVSPGEVLCEVETDKATVEMECMEEGYLAKIIKGDGAQNIKVGEIIAVTVEEEGDIGKFKDYNPSSPAAPAESMPSAEPASAKVEPEPVKAPEPVVSKPLETTRTEDRIFASPLARKLAEDNNVPLSSIKGTGPDGRIVKADIEDYLASTAKGAKVMDAAAVQTLNYADIPTSQIRKVTASRLLLSKQTIPHYYLTVDTCVDKLMELRSQLNSLQEAFGGKRISVNDLVIKAAALALRKVPACNSSWMNDFIRQYHNVNINVAVQTDNGLFVPVIRDADKKGLSTISEEVKHLAQKAKENSLKPEDYEGGTFTVSNMGGPFGIKQFCAIINPPQSGILAVGSAERRVVPGLGPDQFEFASFMSVTLSCDHRVIDGAIGAEWLKAFKGYIENPTSMLL